MPLLVITAEPRIATPAAPPVGVMVPLLLTVLAWGLATVLVSPPTRLMARFDPLIIEAEATLTMSWPLPAPPRLSSNTPSEPEPVAATLAPTLTVTVPPWPTPAALSANTPSEFTPVVRIALVTPTVTAPASPPPPRLPAKPARLPPAVVADTALPP